VDTFAGQTTPPLPGPAPLSRPERRAWWIDGVLAEKARQWEEEARQAREEEERRKMGRRWVDVDGDQVMDTEDEITDLSESGSEDDEDDPEEIKVLKV
jgi:protein SMG6